MRKNIEPQDWYRRLSERQRQRIIRALTSHNIDHTHVSRIIRRGPIWQVTEYHPWPPQFVDNGDVSYRESRILARRKRRPRSR